MVEMLLDSNQDDLPISLQGRDFQTITSPLERQGEVQAINRNKKKFMNSNTYS